MSSPLFNAMGGGMPQNGMMNMIRQFNEFRRTFSGDPKSKVMEMLQSGQLSQAQLNQAQQAAQQFQGMINMMQ